jgi:hypothetical protein
MPPSTDSDDTGSLLVQLGTRIDSLHKIPVSTGVLFALSLASFFYLLRFFKLCIHIPNVEGELECSRFRDRSWRFFNSFRICYRRSPHYNLCRSVRKKMCSHNFSSNFVRRLHSIGFSTRHDPTSHI